MLKNRSSLAGLLTGLFALVVGSAAAADLTGEWSADDGGRYYLRQVGDQLYWYGERSATDPAWANVFQGRVVRDEVRGRWADVPKGGASSHGRLRLEVRRGGNVLVATDKSGGFGGSRWTRAGFVPVLPRPGRVAVDEDCVGFNPDNARVVNRGGRWKIVDGSHSMFDFGSRRNEAQQALRVIRHYGADQSCFVGRPGPSLEYLLVSGRAPRGAMPGEDCIGFDPRNARVERAGGRWKIVDNGHWVFDFGGNEAEARKALAIIRKHGFDHSCFVGRPDPSLQYLRK